MIEVYNYSNGFNFNKQNERINLCLGFFDGLHIGHQHLINSAKQPGVKVGVFTFGGSVKSLTDKRKDRGLLTTIEDRKELLSSIGVDYLFVVEFSPSIMNMSSLDFVDKILSSLPIKSIFVGSDFRFGAKAQGDVNLLKKYYPVEVVDFVFDERGKVSTSEIIKLITNKKIEEANKLLGRNYYVKGEVKHGLSNGARLGFRTANILVIDAYLIPPRGVYATILTYNNKQYLSMTNIGTHPTIDELDAPTIETNIFDFDQDIYSSQVKLEFVEYIRSEKKFSSINELINELTNNKEYIQKKYKI